jgi:hypothetical protein
MEESNKKDDRSIHSDVQADWVLETLVTMANAVPSGSFVGITLNVEGQVVSGKLISAIQYYRSYADIWEGALGTGEHSKGYIEPWRELALTMETEDSESEDAPPPRYIHLADAKYIYGTSIIPTSEGMLWRGLISKVSGFSLGVLEVGQA